MDKKFWGPDDYKNVWFEIRYKTPQGEEYPRLSNPETAEVFRKIVDPQNYESVLEDSELGPNYKSEVSQEFFDQIRNLVETYSGTDVQDKFVYPEELAALRNFFLGFQIVYFRVGNESIASQSDDQATIRKNEQTVVNNFENQLENLRLEKAYGHHAANLADGINVHFMKLIETFPKANYNQMLATAKAMQDKAQTQEIKAALSRLITKLESMQPKTADPV